ncbi:MAG: MBL fold metallo-hydrolase [Rhodothermales bacterium]|nr:MBL fold metallo-hydrolase [Rhodothermales bacterium]
MRVTLLGTGTSTGVPVIGCDCDVCTSEDPRDTRMRCSCLIEVNGMSLLIDSGPDFRQQALSYGIKRVDAVLYTHHHFDHVAGMDDLRPFLFGNRLPIPCYARPNTSSVLRKMYNYIFSDGSYPGVPRLELKDLCGPFSMTGRYEPKSSITVTPIEVIHGELELYGYRIGDFAYVTDTNNIPDSSIEQLRNLDVLVLDALRDQPHPMHFTIDEAVQTATRIGAKKTYFIHMTHTVSHAATEKRLPENIHLAYDGLVVELD